LPLQHGRLLPERVRDCRKRSKLGRHRTLRGDADH
jgi:hypothetical protein